MPKGEESVPRTAEALYTRFFEPLKRYLRRLGATAEDAEDLVHDVLIGVIYIKIHQFTLQPGGSFQAWLYRIARNTYFNWCKRAQRMVDFDHSPTTDMSDTESDGPLSRAAERGSTLLSGYTQTHQNMFDNIHATMDIEQLLDAAGLTDWERLVVQLKIYWDLKPADIAAIIEGQTAEDVSRTFYNAKIKLGKHGPPSA